jgi:hypothetical protein
VLGTLITSAHLVGNVAFCLHLEQMSGVDDSVTDGYWQTADEGMKDATTSSISRLCVNELFLLLRQKILNNEQ